MITRIIFTLLFGLVCLIIGYQIQADRYHNYSDFDRATVQMKNYQYNLDTFNCKQFVEVFGGKLDDIGIRYTPIVIRQNDKYDHAVVAVWFDPATRQFVKNGQYIRNLEEVK